MRFAGFLRSALMEFVSYADIEQLPTGADRLFAQGEKDSMFFSRPWFENLAHSFLRDARVMSFACVVDGDDVLAILPLTTRTGDIWHSLGHPYGSLYTLLLADDDQERILSCLVQGLSASGIDALLLEPVAEIDNRVNGLQRGMEAIGFHCQRSFRFYNWIVRMQGQSYADYMANRPSKLRNTITRKKRKLERERGYRIRLFAGVEAPRAMSDYYAVYGSSWKANEQYPDFLDGMVAAFSRAGWSRLAILYIDGQAAAAQLWFVRHEKASIFRLAYDETWRPYSPGTILTDHMMEHVIDTDQVAEIDFLTGNEAYKQDWMSERRERWSLSCVRSRRPRGRFDLVTETLGRIFKRR